MGPIQLFPSPLPLHYWAAALVAALWWYASFLYLRRRSENLPPGPTGLPILGCLPFLDPELHTHFATLAHTHGPIYRIALGSKLGIVVSSPALAREVLRDHDAVTANRDVPSAVARVIFYGGHNIVWTPNGPTWRMLRRVCVQKMLSPSSLDSVYHLRRREVRATVKRLLSSAGKQVDVGELVFLSMMNVTTSVLWGGPLGLDGGGATAPAVGIEFRKLVGEIMVLIGKPNLSDFFPALERFDLQGIGKKMMVLLGRFDQMFDRIIDEKRNLMGKSSNEAKDLLDFLLKLEAEGGDDNIPFNMMHVKGLLMDMFFGGTDTTSSTVEFAMAEMMNRSDIIRKAQEELELVVGKGNTVEESHMSKLRYLEAVVKEVLRLHPVVPLLVPRCPSSSFTVGGYNIPKGSRVFVNAWAIHRDPLVWDNPAEFRPERFLDTSKKWEFNGSDFSYLPFGSGRRICAGIPMAQRMTMYSLASLLHSFDWKLPEGTKLDLSEKFGIVLKKAKPLIAIPTPRLPNLELYS